jgi:hypothetical protein
VPEESELTSSEAIAGVALEGPAGSPGPLPGRRDDEAGLPPDPPLPGSLVQGVDIPALLALGGSANLAIYAITLLAGLLPLRPFDPVWQGAAVALCVNNGGFALMGLLLIQLAAYLDPSNDDLQLRSRRHRHRAAVAAVAFLLLIPLQGFASWRQVVDHDREQARNRMAAERTFSEISRAVTTSASVPQLAGRLESLKAGRISQQDFNRPLAELQQEVLAGIRAARLQLGERINPLGANEIWAIVQESLRRIAMALILAVFFAGSSQLPGSQLSLLGSFNAVLDEGFQRRLQARHDRRRRREERIRFRDHLEAEARARQEQETPPDPRLDFAHQAQDLLLHTLLLQHGVPLSNGEAFERPRSERIGSAESRLINRSEQDPPESPQERAARPPLLRFVSSQDPGLQLEAQLLPDGSGSLLRFNRPVRPLSFSLGPLPNRGEASSFSIAQAEHLAEQGPMAWWEDFDYPLAAPFPLEPGMPLEMLGAAPEGLLHGHNPHGLLPIALLKVEEPRPGFLQVLAEEWQIWRGRLGGRRSS